MPVKALHWQHHAADGLIVVCADRIGAVAKAKILLSRAHCQHQIGAAAPSGLGIGHVDAHQPAGQHALTCPHLHRHNAYGAGDVPLGVGMNNAAGVSAIGRAAETLLGKVGFEIVRTRRISVTEYPVEEPPNGRDVLGGHRPHTA